jgi:chemotaxis protein MotB
MSDGKAAEPIIIVRKKGGHGGHHGGAWKVAYADFVTAMMAFFLVMWLVNSSQEVKDAVAGYFKDPLGYGKEVGSGQGGMGPSLALGKDDMGKLKEKLEQAIKEMPEFESVKDQVKMTVTGEGLRIELLETEKGMFFESGSPAPTNSGKELIEKLAAELGKLENRILIEGHTDAKPFPSERGYSNWELSADRANAARRLMQTSGLRQDQVGQVRGYADQQLFKRDNPLDAGNRRVSVLVQYRDKPPEPEAKGGKEAPHGGGEKKAEAPKAAGGHGGGAPKAAH